MPTNQLGGYKQWVKEGKSIERIKGISQKI